MAARRKMAMQLRGMDRAHYTTMYITKGIDPRTESRALRKVIIKADRKFKAAGGILRSDGTHRMLDSYQAAWANALDESYERLGIKVMDSAEVPIRDIYGLNGTGIERAYANGDDAGEVIARSIEFEDRGTISPIVYREEILGQGILLRESKMAFGSPSRFFEGFQGGHGRDIHLIQGLVAAEALEKKFGPGSFKSFLTSLSSESRYNIFWGSAYEAGGLEAGEYAASSMLFPSLRMVTQGWGILPWIK